MTTVDLKTLLLTGAAAFGATISIGSVRAQTTAVLDLNPVQSGTVTRPSAEARPGTFTNPTPGTIVIHIGGRVDTGFKSIWSSVDQRFATAPAGTFGGPPLAADAGSAEADVHDCVDWHPAGADEGRSWWTCR